MTPQQFINLDEMEQAETLWDKGVHIGERFDEVYSILLYQIDGFYVEAFYNREHNSLVRFEVFSDMNELAPYLNRIDVVNSISKNFNTL